MRYLLSVVTLLCVSLVPIAAESQTVPPGFRLVCRNGVCSLQRIIPTVQVQPTVYGLAATPPTIFTTASYAPVPTVTSTYDPAPLAAAPLVQGTTCNCAVTGVCTCDPATCVCPSCMNGQVRMAALRGATTYQTSTPYVTYQTAAPTVMYAAQANAGATTTYATPGGGLTASYDAFGNLYTAHTGGAYNRKLQRHLQRGYRKFGIAP